MDRLAFHGTAQGSGARAPGWARASLIAAIAFALGLLAARALPFAGLGPLSSHMAGHILLMNVAAPAAALLISRQIWRQIRIPGGVAAPTAIQIAILWAWHTPAALGAAHTGGVAILAGLSLFAVALWFWCAILAQRGAQSWRAILALLVTGKLFCLLGALTVFAPRILYPHLSHSPAAADGLNDQQLAGLIMLAACPLTYVLAGVVAAARFLDGVAARTGWER